MRERREGGPRSACSRFILIRMDLGQPRDTIVVTSPRELAHRRWAATLLVAMTSAVTGRFVSGTGRTWDPAEPQQVFRKLFAIEGLDETKAGPKHVPQPRCFEKLREDLEMRARADAALDAWKLMCRRVTDDRSGSGPASFN